MITAVIPIRLRAADLFRKLVMAGLMFALVSVAYMALTQFGVERKCRGGAFSLIFSSGFDVRRCDLVIRRFGHEIGRIPLN
jgi:hypothetical protein